MKPWLIKVLNGPNAGAQILVSGEVTVGTSVDCDLILNDPHICSIHCQIKKEEEESFDIIPKEGIVFINGKKVEAAVGKLKLGDVLTLGSTHLTGGPSEQLWPPVTIPVIQEVRAEAAAPSPAGEAPKEPKTTAGSIKKGLALSRQSILRLILVGVLLFFGTAFLRVLVHNNLKMKKSEFKPSVFQKTEEADIKEEQKITQGAIQSLQKLLPKIYIKPITANGQNVFYIYTKDQVEYDEVRRILNKKNLPIVNVLINIDDIDDSGIAMMQALNLSVSITVDEKGRATWTGYVPTQNAFDSMKEQIARDIPAITDNTYHIILGEEAAKTAMNILMKNQFGAIVVTPEQNNLTLTGSVFEGDQLRWKGALQELETTFGNKVKLANLVLVSPTPVQQQIFFNAPVVSVSISSFPYAVLRNGEHIFIGAKVRNGYTVEAITTKGIELVNHGSKKLIPISGQ
ncbi:MAG: FHA domain-containing protein [Chthoniobacterales bacterium]|nr:FHA domain-containing protein [Chthoniobacterales bacterium]